MQTCHETLHTLNHSEAEIKFETNCANKIQTDTILRDILYPEVVLYTQISTFTITEIFLMISNLQHIIPKLKHCTLDSRVRR